jgi:hypothetical protein
MGASGKVDFGGSPNRPRPRRVEEDRWAELLAEKAASPDGKGEPMNVRRRPLQLPPMERVKDG